MVDESELRPGPDWRDGPWGTFAAVCFVAGSLGLFVTMFGCALQPEVQMEPPRQLAEPPGPPYEYDQTERIQPTWWI